MTVTFNLITLFKKYSRDDLAKLWSYNGTSGLKRGVITPANTKFIILFVTKDKDKFATQYNDFISDNILHWEGENGHANDARIIKSTESGDEIYLFYRDKPRELFTYYGKLNLIKYQQKTSTPSSFVFNIDSISKNTDIIDDLKNFENKNSHLTSTEKEILIKSRIGQGKFRDDLITMWGGCAVTGLTNCSLLVASHIKPWRDCDNVERLDPMNGLLLSPNLDKLFDSGLISFDDAGNITISDLLSNADQHALGINTSMKLRFLKQDHIHFLKYHVKHVFKKSG